MSRNLLQKIRCKSCFLGAVIVVSCSPRVILQVPIWSLQKFEFETPGSDTATLKS